MTGLIPCLDVVASNMNKELAALLENEDRLKAVAKAAFDQVDSDRSGFIDRAELETVMTRVAKSLRMPTPSSSEIDTVMHEIDTNEDGRVSFLEYVELVKRTLRKLTGQSPAVTKQEEVKQTGQSSPEGRQEESKNEEVLRQVRMFERYLEDTGLTKAFQIIFAEIISKKIEPANVFAYCAMRLRQIGKEIAHLLPKNLTASLVESTEPAAPS